MAKMYDPKDLMFVVGTGHMGRMVEILLLERDLVMERDPDGLTPIDSSSTLGLPPKLGRTPAGQRGVVGFMGKGEEARKALTDIGMEEAPVAYSHEQGAFVYVTKDSDTDSRITPRTRTLYEAEDVTMGGLTATKFRIFHRFPGEPDWSATMESLSDAVKRAIPFLDEDGSFVTIHPRATVEAWLEKAKVVQPHA